MKGFFDMDTPFWSWVGRIPEMVLLSLLWVLCSLPVITIIPASCALYDAISRCTVFNRPGSVRRFFRSFVRELKRGILLSLLYLLIAVIMVWTELLMQSTESLSNTAVIMLMLQRIVGISVLGYLCWLIPLQSRYNHSFVALHVNALKFFLGRFPKSCLLLIISVAVCVVCTLHPSLMALCIVAPALIAIFHAKIIEKVFMQVFPNDYIDGMPVSSAAELELINSQK